MQVFIYSVLTLALLGGLFATMLIVADRLLTNYGPCDVGVNDRPPLTVEGGCTLMDALYENRVFIPSGCGGQGTCGHCKVTVLSGGGPVLPTELPLLSKEEIASGVRLACQVKVKQDVAIRIPAAWLSVQEFRAVLAGARMLTHDMRELRIRLLRPERIEFRAGQYVQVQVPARGGPAHRAYSISSTPDRQGEIELVVRRIPGGVGSNYMHAIDPGQELTLTGPYGEFVLDEDPAKEVVCVAGGCGIAPAKSIVEYVRARWPERPCTLFFGVRTEADVFYAEEFGRIAKEWPAFSVCYALSEPDAPDEWTGETGFVHLSVDRRLDCGAARQAFLCGPEPMIRATEEVLRSKDVPQDMIFYERW